MRCSAELEREASAALRARGVEAPEIRRRAALRYDGSDTALEVALADDMRPTPHSSMPPHPASVSSPTRRSSSDGDREAVGRG
jgi:hypothetical protein